jgi:hypothetical protein
MAGQHPIDRQTLNQTTREKIKKTLCSKNFERQKPQPTTPHFSN